MMVLEVLQLIAAVACVAAAFAVREAFLSTALVALALVNAWAAFR